MAAIDQYHKNTPIYIDSDLKSNISGQDFAKELHKKGFTTLYLATGYNPIDFDEMPWITKIVGKEPPF